MADEKKVVKSAEKDGAKSSKTGKAKKPNIFKRIAKYFRDTKGEFKKIVWPTFPSVVRNTLVTLALCLVLGVLIIAVDSGLGALINLAMMLKG
ncbi:MAG: preprotein translocase subunit SecE [Clostridia bacterium]|nr:preprotein translocase subunit SecE [Clostridia bacterium]